MASSQKKQTAAKKTAAAKEPARKRRTKPVEQQPRTTHGRLIGAGVCLLLALCVAVSYFSADAFFLAIFATVLKGLFGYGYWAAAAVLAVTGVNLLRHRDRPVTLRTVCTLLLVMIVGVLCHLLLCRGEYTLGTASLLPSLWRDGQLLKCGGAFSGLLATALLAGAGGVRVRRVPSLPGENGPDRA